MFNEFYIEWFTDKGTISVNATATNDASVDLSAMFMSGIKKLHLTNSKYYYLASTVTIPGDITITGDSQVLDQASLLSSGVTPCFYVSGDTIAFNVDCSENDADRRSVYMKGIHIWRIQPNFTGSDFKENIPVVKLDVNQKLWGCELELFVSAEQKSVNTEVADGTTKYLPNLGYTGLEVYVHGTSNYLTYANFSGYFKNLRRAFNIHKDNTTSWITGVTISAETSCARGGEVYDAVVGGKHQSRRYFPNYEELSYFNAEKSIRLVGAIFDCDSFDSTNQLGSPRYGISANKDITYTNGIEAVYPDYRKQGFLLSDWKSRSRGLQGGVANLNLQGNILEDFFFKTFGPISEDKYIDSTTLKNYAFIGELSYTDTSDNVIPITKDNVTNYDKLFALRYESGVSSSYLQDLNSFPCVTATPAKKFAVKVKTPVYLFQTICGVISRSTLSFRVAVKNGSGSTLVFSGESSDNDIASNINYSAIFVPTSIFPDYIIEMEVSTTDGTFTSLPKLFICSANTNNAITPSGGVVGGNLRMADAEFFNEEQRVSGLREQCNRIVAGGYLLKAVWAAETQQVAHMSVYSLDDRYLYLKLATKTGVFDLHINQKSGEYRTNFTTGTLKVYYKYSSYLADFVVTYQGPDMLTVLEAIGSGPTKILPLGIDISEYTEATIAI